MMLYDFVTDVSRHVEGIPESENDGPGLMQTIRPEHEIFRTGIKGSVPEFSTLERCMAIDPDEDTDCIYIDEVYQKANKCVHICYHFWMIC